MRLTDAAIKKIKPGAKPVKMTDGEGLYLAISPSGTRTWRLRYEWDGAEQTLTIGRYPDVSLKAAREAREAAKERLRRGVDPRIPIAERPERTFKVIAEAWHAKSAARWSASHAASVMRMLKNDVFPIVGTKDIDDITAADVLVNVLQPIEKRGAIDAARRIRYHMHCVFVHGIASGIGKHDPASVVLPALQHATKSRHHAVTTIEEAREVIRRVDEVPAQPHIKLGLRLLAMTVVRSAVVLTAPWDEFRDIDPDAPLWIVPAWRQKLRMANKRDPYFTHYVPLPRQAIETIDVLRKLTGDAPYLLPHRTDPLKPVGGSAFKRVLGRAGYQGEHTPHGWRSTFSTILNERFPADREVIDLMLSHVPRSQVERAYNRSLHLERRAELAQEWADMLMDGQRPAADLLDGPRRASP